MFKEKKSCSKERGGKKKQSEEYYIFCSRRFSWRLTTSPNIGSQVNYIFLKN